MTNLFQVVSCHQGVCYYENPDSLGIFSYVPGEPQLSVDGDGKPIVNLLVSDVGAVLQLQTQWALTEQLRVAITQEIAQRHRELEPSAISLQFANVSNTQASLVVGDGQGKWRKLAQTKSFGIAPYNTVFNTKLGSADKEKVISALNGTANYLKLQYQSSLTLISSVQIVISGDVTQDLQQLTEPEKEDKSFWNGLLTQTPETELKITLEASFTQVEEALAAGRLKLTQTITNQPSDDLKLQVTQSAKLNAARQLLRLTQTPIAQESLLQAKAQEQETLNYNIERSVDLGTYFSNNLGTDYIQVSPLTIDEPEELEEEEAKSEITKTVSLGFDPEDAHLSKIKVSWGGATVNLRRPKFSTASLAGSGDTIVITTCYTKPGRSFTTEIPANLDSELVLQPEHLGLVEVKLDGSQIQAQGAKRARIVLHYDPSGEGSRDTQIVNFDHGDSTWQGSWYIVTRSPNLDGTIEWYWQETPETGDPTKYPTVITEEVELRLAS